MYPPITNISFTICFCKAGDKVLMLLRTRPPNKGLWNGIGGKIENGETLQESLRREVLEEVDLDIHDAQEIYFGGIVTWTGVQDPNNDNRGMYAFVVEFPEQTVIDTHREIDEGILEWKSIPWVCDHGNRAVAQTVPYFLPRMLGKCPQAEYRCVFEHELIKEFLIRPWKSSSMWV